jgi:hypothetical protein
MRFAWEAGLDVDVSEVIVEKILDSLVDRTQAIGQSAREFPLAGQEWFDEFDLSVFGFLRGAAPAEPAAG